MLKLHSIKTLTKKTATILSNLRQDGLKFTSVQKYTPEYLQYLNECEKSRFSFIKNCFEVIKIETLVENGTISRDTSIQLHKNNDIINPIKH